jgi:hypothetical protein
VPVGGAGTPISRRRVILRVLAFVPTAKNKQDRGMRGQKSRRWRPFSRDEESEKTVE